MSAHLLNTGEQTIQLDADIQITKRSGLCLLLGPRELHPICRQAKAMHIEQVELSGCFSIMARAGCSSLYDAHSEPCLPSTTNAQ